METEGLLLAQVALAVEVQDRIAPFPSNRLRKLSKAVRKNRPVRFVGWRLANCWQLSTGLSTGNMLRRRPKPLGQACRNGQATIELLNGSCVCSMID